MSKSYKCARKEQYPAIGDQLDALWKGLAAIADGQPVPTDTITMMAAIEAVKADNPKSAS